MHCNVHKLGAKPLCAPQSSCRAANTIVTKCRKINCSHVALWFLLTLLCLHIGASAMVDRAEREHRPGTVCLRQLAA